MNKEQINDSGPEQDEMSQDRREFMKKLGKYAAVTPPVVAGLMTGSRSAASDGNNGGGNDNQDWSAWCASAKVTNPNYPDRCL